MIPCERLRKLLAAAAVVGASSSSRQLSAVLSCGSR